jgi:anti-sigma regulatory factor (Ser/Thr protein kinase)
MSEIAFEDMASRGSDDRDVDRHRVAPLELPPEARSAGLARGYVRGRLAAMGRLDLLECAELGVDELVANVCLHAQTPLLLSVRGTANRSVRIEVTDYSTAEPVRQVAQSYSLGGRGLTLLDACGAWGLSDPPATGGKTIWFEPGATLTGALGD